MKVSERGEEKMGSRMEGEGREGKCWSPMLSPPTTLLFLRHPRLVNGSCPRLLAGVHCSYIALVGLAMSLTVCKFTSSS
jgi:hypothetical protein